LTSPQKFSPKNSKPPAGGGGGKVEEFFKSIINGLLPYAVRTKKSSAEDLFFCRQLYVVFIGWKDIKDLLSLEYSIKDTCQDPWKKSEKNCESILN